MARYVRIGLVCATLLWVSFLSRADTYVAQHIYFYCASGACDVTPTHTYDSSYVYDQSGTPVATMNSAGDLHGWNSQPVGFVYQP